MAASAEEQAVITAAKDHVRRLVRAPRGPYQGGTGDHTEEALAIALLALDPNLYTDA